MKPSPARRRTDRPRENNTAKGPRASPRRSLYPLGPLLLPLLLGMAAPAYTRDLNGLAFVQEDGTLRIHNRTVRLYGIYIPPTNRQCRTEIRPVRCAPRATLMLDFKVRGFVHCVPQHDYTDGSVAAICYVDRSGLNDGEDLGAYLIRRGWALALPDAPFEYQAMEKIARTRELGVWGFPADSFSFGRRPSLLE